MPLVLVAGLAGLAAAQVPPVTVTVELTGNLSFVVTVLVLATPGCLVSVSSTASITGVVTVPVQAGAVPVHRGSPPPVTVAVLAVGLAALDATATGTVITMLPLAAFAAIEQFAKLVVLEQPDRVPPVAVMLAATVVMPAGSASVNVIGAVVGPLATAIVMV